MTCLLGHCAAYVWQKLADVSGRWPDDGDSKDLRNVGQFLYRSSQRSGPEDRHFHVRRVRGTAEKLKPLSNECMLMEIHCRKPSRAALYFSRISVELGYNVMKGTE
jgi:hypothetical protein